MASILLVVGLRVNVALFLRDVRAVHLPVVLVVVGDNTTQSGTLAVCMWDRAVEGVVSGAVTVVTAVEPWAVPGIMSGVGDLAVEALVGSSGARSGLGRC